MLEPDYQGKLDALINFYKKDNVSLGKLKGNIGDVLKKQLTNSNDEIAGNAQIAYNRLRPQLSKALTEKELQKLDTLSAMTLTKQIRSKAGKTEMSDNTKESDHLKASVLGAAASKALPGGTSLIMANAMRRYFMKMLTGADPEALKKAKSMISDPKEFIKSGGALKAAKTDKTSKNIERLFSPIPRNTNQELQKEETKNG